MPTTFFWTKNYFLIDLIIIKWHHTPYENAPIIIFTFNTLKRQVNAIIM